MGEVGNDQASDGLGTALSKRLAGSGATVRAFPVFDLRRGTATTFFCVPTRSSAEGKQFGHRLLAQHDEASLAAIDLAFLDDTIAYAKRFAQQKLIAAIGTAVAFSTMARPQSRKSFVEKLNAARALATTPLVVKVDLIPAGTPTTRLAEIVTALRFGVQRVFVTVPETRERTWNPGAIGAAGLGFQLSPTETAEGAGTKARLLGALAQSQGAISYIDGMVLPEVVEAVTVEGIRFGTGPALSLDVFPLNGGLPKVPLPARPQ